MTVPHPERISPNMARKGRRLHQQGRIHYTGLAPTYEIQGDHGTYGVTVRNGTLSCTCPHHGICSHISGTMETMLASPHSVVDQMLELGQQWFAEHPNGAFSDDDWREFHRFVLAGIIAPIEPPAAA